MKKMYKAMALVLCAILLVVGSVMGTLAYLQYKTETISNVMTVGKVEITLSESVVDEYGVAVGGEIVATKDGVVGEPNSYKLVPGRTYTKDPTIIVSANSEECYLFAEIKNNLGNDATLAMVTGWTQINGTDYWMYNTKVPAGAKVGIFTSFTCGTSITNETTYATSTIEVSAYAVQAYGFTTAAEAWGATFGKTN